jgi:hypothetical protein
LALALFLFGCSSSSKSTDHRNPGSGESVAVPAGARPQPSARDALVRLLAAEKALDYRASYQYVQHDADQPYPTVATWTKYREDLPRITGFSVSTAAGDQVVATVEHRPGIDPFVGLSPARERQTWEAVRAGAGWLLLENPGSVPEVPPDARATAAASAWVTAVQSCDRAAAARLQAVDTLFDSTTTTPALCHANGAVIVGPAGPLAPGPASGDIVSQYTTNALSWARVVSIESPARFAVILAPIGSHWKVLGLTDHS